eukprot:TRINITY_DN8641_c0_g1_i1.p1 TRINITY_DN8641_c0_g1~~TRINITY_DN8641_c0_g1_i1.p1  ORF type:complete len:108 (-),score=20.33 TRINITY_DN8641_c0_g1_i1:21-344(-)
MKVESSKVLLHIACPKPKCTKEPFYWTHAEDDEKIWLYADGDLECESGHRYFIQNWRFACSEHPGEYYEPKYSDLSYAIGLAIMNSSSMGVEFLTNVTVQIKKRWKE